MLNSNSPQSTIDPASLQVILATDCGSTTTKAVLFEKTPTGWRQTFRGEAPTTVERPVQDVTIGAINAFREVEELSGRKILRGETSAQQSPFLPRANGHGIDLYISTSSAGGGLQMVVAGVVSNMSAESAQRAALGAGAIVMDTLSLDDGREPHERIQKIRHLRPDIILIAGGTEGGTVDHPLELAEMILQAAPRPRFGDTLKLPVVYAANSKACHDAEVILHERFGFFAVNNIRPALDREDLGPAREAIHELFLQHVMSHAPGYRKLLAWSPVPVIPTPSGFGNMVLSATKTRRQHILAVDIGGATTDVFSTLSHPGETDIIFNRTVSANLGMSYSIANVLYEAGIESIMRWLPMVVSEDEVRNRLNNKMIRPTTIPQYREDLLLEQAVCREALRLSLQHHKKLASDLKGAQKIRTVGEMFKQESVELFDLMAIDLIIGSGGVLSHAPDRRSAALMLVDAFEPIGITQLAVDSIFMMPHLGVLATVHEQAARDIFFRDCLVGLGTVIAPKGRIKLGRDAFRVTFERSRSHIVRAGELLLVEIAQGSLMGHIEPLQSSLDFGAGPGNAIDAEIHGGEVGVLLDARERPLKFAATEADRREQAWKTHEALGISI